MPHPDGTAPCSVEIDRQSLRGLPETRLGQRHAAAGDALMEADSGGTYRRAQARDPGKPKRKENRQEGPGVKVVGVKKP